MTELDNALWKRILYLVQKIGRPFSYTDFAPNFNVDGDQVCNSIGNSSDSKVKLLIIDSMIFHYKGEYSERSRLAERASKFNIYMYKLHHLAVTKKIVVVITNHATTQPDEDYGIPKPFGGNILSNASRCIINLGPAGKSRELISATLTKSTTRGLISLQILTADFGFYDAHNMFADEATSEKD
jgi:Rad51